MAKRIERIEFNAEMLASLIRKLYNERRRMRTY